MYSSQFTNRFKLMYHLQVLLVYATRVEHKEWRNPTEEKIVRDSLAHHEREAAKLLVTKDPSTENILSSNEEVSITPSLQLVC